MPPAICQRSRQGWQTDNVETELFANSFVDELFDIKVRWILGQYDFFVGRVIDITNLPTHENRRKAFCGLLAIKVVPVWRTQIIGA